MFREMRRSRQQLSEAETEQILQRGTSGVLALSGDEGYPYALPISYLYAHKKLYFHSALEGHKLDAIRRDPKASFCVIDRDMIDPLQYTTLFRSAIAFGKIRVLTDEAEKRAAIDRLAIKYAPEDTQANRGRVIAQAWDRLCMLEMTVEHISGKQGIELVDKP